MKTAQKIEKEISKIKQGTTFKYQQLAIEFSEYQAAAKAIERLIAKGIIKRVSTGVFYKPKQTVFGELKPNEEEILKSYLFQKNKRIAYITGVSLYNKMGLTTQVPKNIKIASRDKRISVSIGNIKGNPVKSYADVTDDNYYLLEVLDALKDFNNIPDLSKDSGIEIILNKLNVLNLKDKKRLIKYAMYYPPRVRAFLGALFERIEFLDELNNLKKSLNPFSQYSYGIDETILPTIANWNIK